MRKFVIPALAPALVLAAASVAAPAAAQSYGQAYHRPAPHPAVVSYWQPINARQASLDRRIDQGVRSGRLSRREAAGLRAEFNSLLRLEANYRRGGLTVRERADLDRRFDRLSAKVSYERHDGNRRRG